jgi:hypothetical protein
MNRLPLAQVVVVNAILIALLVLITENYGLRAAYWGSEGFTSNMVRYPFFFITSAARGPTHIPGLFSVDWQQVILVVLILADAIFALGVYRSRRPSQESGTSS